MVSIHRIVKDHRETGSLANLLSLWGFVDDRTFLTKGGAVGVAFRLRGVDDDCLDHEERRTITLRFEQALRQLDETFRVYQYLFKDVAQPLETASSVHPVVQQALQRRASYFAGKARDLFEVETFLVILYEGRRTGLKPDPIGLLSSPGLTFGRRLSAAETVAAIDSSLRAAIVHLHQKAHAFVTQLADTIHPAVLQKPETFHLLRRLLNYTPHKVQSGALKSNGYLDFYVSDSAVECHRNHLDVDGVAVKALTMKEPPAKTFAHMLRDLCGIPGTFFACLEWQRLPAARIRREIHSRRRHFFNKKVSLVNYVQSQTKPEEMLVDESATATVQELGHTLTEVEVHGRFFGACSLTVVVHDRDPRRVEQAAAEAVKVFASHDGVLYEESHNLLNAWLAVVPGNTSHNLRRLSLLNTNIADLSFLFGLDAGARTSGHLGARPCLAVFETAQRVPYCWNLHYHDVGHVLIQGATGAGKSFLTNFILTHGQQYDPTTFIFDLGGGYEFLTTRLGGSAWRLGLNRQPFTINPFCLTPTPEHLHFLYSFIRVLVQGTEQYRCSMQDERELYEAVGNLYALDPAQRRLFTLANLLPRHLAQHLQRWVQGGPYSEFFDHADDTLTFQRLQCFDFEGLERFPAVLEPLLFYILHRASDTVRDRTDDSTLKLFVLDEAWRFVRDDTVKQYVTEALKTWRKRNGAIILATQSTEDFADSDLLRTVLENCPTKFFLANPGIDIQRARQLFHLNHTEAARIASLRPRQEVLLKRPDVAKVVQLNVEPESLWMYGNGPSPEALSSMSSPSDLIH